MEGRILVFVLTFCLGLLSSLSGTLPLIGLILLTFGVGVPVVVSSIVIYQGAWLRLPWRPSIGKGFLATFLWFLQLPLILIVGLLATLPPVDREAIDLTPSPFGVAVFTIVVGAIGVALCNWVSRYNDNGRHWLLRSSNNG